MTGAIKLGVCDGRTFSLLPDAATQTYAFLGRKGSGKTYLATKLLEEFVHRGVQCVALDVVGNWYGVRIAANGKDRGLDLPVLGGLRGDISITPTSGALIADAVVDSGQSVVIDISQFSRGHRQQFAYHFGERLWIRKKQQPRQTALHIFLEESQLILPENLGTFAKEFAAQMLGTYEEIVRLGRNFGIGVTMISQRPQSVNKEVLNQAECIGAFQISGAHEREALRKWMTHHDADVNLVNELPYLPQGVAYIWSPQWLRAFSRVEISRKSTFDASATPKAGVAARSVSLKPINMEDLKARMAAVVQEHNANDLTQLKARIATLERELAAAKKAVTSPDELSKLRAQITSTVHASLAGRDEEWRGAMGRLAAAVGERLTSVIENPLAYAPSDIGKIILDSKAVNVAPSLVAKPSANGAPQRKPALSDASLSKYQTSLLQVVLSRHPVPTQRSQLSMLSGKSTKSSAFSPNLQSLIDAGLIVEQNGGYVATEEAVTRYGGSVSAPKSGQDALSYWLNKLPSYESSFLRALTENGQHHMTVQELSAAAGRSVTSSAFMRALNNLVQLGHVNKVGEAYVAAGTFFE